MHLIVKNMLHLDEIMMTSRLHLTKVGFRSASYTEQQSVSRHVAQLGHIIPSRHVAQLGNIIPSQPDWLLLVIYQYKNIYFLVFGLTENSKLRQK